MENFTPLTGFAGGLLIGLSALIVLLTSGRIAGVSGVLGGIFSARPEGGAGWRLLFLAGLPVGALVFHVMSPDGLQVNLQAGWPAMLAAGLLVGFGTSMGNGCTSGHGVCGLARFSARSLVATVTFMGVAAVTVFVIRHVLGGAA